MKISLNPDHSQKGFAFVCFENEEDAKKATLDGAGIAFEPKDNRSVMMKLVNNIYFKNIPASMT